MISGRKKGPSRLESSEGSELIAFECPTCKLLHWHKGRSKERRYCPFCSRAQPDYLTRIVPEPMVEREAPQLEAAPDGEREGVSPFILEFFMVQGNGFRCMAYRNADGKWRGAVDDEVLPGAVRVLG